MEFIRRNSFLPILFFLMLMLLIFLNLWQKTVVQHVSYSEFKRKIERKDFEEIEISKDAIRGVMLSPTEKNRRNPENISVSPMLDTDAKIGGSIASDSYPRNFPSKTNTLDDAASFLGFSSSANYIVYEAVRLEPDPSLITLLDTKDVPYTFSIRTSYSESFLVWLFLPIFLLILFNLFLRKSNTSLNNNQGTQFMSFGKNRAKVIAEEGIGITFSDVAGIDEAKEELEEVIDFLKTPKKFQRLGGRIPKGVLLMGPPGTGKTLLAKAVAGEAKVPFFSLSGSDFVEMFVGVGAARVRDLFEQAQKRAPCIVFIDELDAIGKSRALNGGFSSNDEREQTLNQLLVEMDGFDSYNGVIIMAATNRPEVLDPALLRPGRFDRSITVAKPDIKGREQILTVHAKKIKLSPTVEIKVLAQKTPGFTGADLSNVINEAALLAARKDKLSIELSDFEAAIERMIAGLSKKTGILNQKEKKVVSFHESGHVIVAACVKFSDPVHKVSIIPRGMGALGYTLQVPLEDKFLMNKQELLDRITIFLGGRAAESLIFDDISTGAADDLSRSTDIAKRMVKEFGMSLELGNRYYSDRQRSPFLSSDSSYSSFGEREYSEETQNKIDSEIDKIISECYQKAIEILKERMFTLKTMANKLFEVEVLERNEIEQLIASTHPSAISEDGVQA